MTRLAQKWNEAPPHKMCKVEDFSWKIAGSEETRVRLVYDASKCRIKRSESIIYEFSSIFPGDRGQVSVEVISPSGTHSKLLSKRKKDHNVAEFKDVQMKSVHFWQESARGLWIVEFDWKVPKSKLSSIFESKKPEGAPQQPFILRSNLKIYGH